MRHVQVLSPTNELLGYVEPHLTEGQVVAELRNRSLKGTLRISPCDEFRAPIDNKALSIVVPEGPPGLPANRLFKSPSPGLRPARPFAHGEAAPTVDPISIIERADAVAERAREKEREAAERAAEREREMRQFAHDQQIESARRAAEAEREAAARAIEAHRAEAAGSRSLFEEMLKITQLQASHTVNNVKDGFAQANAAQAQAALQIQQSLQQQLDDARRENLELRGKVSELTADLREAANDRTSNYNRVAAETRAEFAREIETKTRQIESLQDRLDRLTRELAERQNELTTVKIQAQSELAAAKSAAQHNEALLRQQIEIVKMQAEGSADFTRQIKTLEVLMSAPADKAKLAMSVLGVDDPDTGDEPESSGIERTVAAVGGLVDRLMPVLTRGGGGGSGSPIATALPPGEGDSL